VFAIMAGKHSVESRSGVALFGSIWSVWCSASDGASLDQAKKRVADYLMSKYAAKLDPWFPHNVGSNVIKALSGDRSRSLMRGAIPAQATTAKLLR